MTLQKSALSEKVNRELGKIAIIKHMINVVVNTTRESVSRKLIRICNINLH